MLRVRGECSGQNAFISASGYEQGRDSRDFCWFDACMQGEKMQGVTGRTSIPA